MLRAWLGVETSTVVLKSLMMAICLEMVRKPVKDEARYERVWQEHVFALKDQYSMND